MKKSRIQSLIWNRIISSLIAIARAKAYRINRKWKDEETWDVAVEGWCLLCTRVRTVVEFRVRHT